MRIRITMNDVGVIEALDRAERTAGNLGPVMQRIAEDLQAISHNAFDVAADPSTGTPWVPLKASTLKARAKKGQTAFPILQETRELFRRVQVDSDDRSAHIGAGVEYALIHQVGSAPNQGIPARPFVGADDIELEHFERVLARYIESKIP